MNSDVARFITPAQTCSQPDLLQDRFDVGGKTRNIAIQLVLQQSCPFFRTLSHAFAFSDLDECTSSPPVCDINADCTNTRGSYLCTCKAGFSGDGKTCSRKEKFLLSFLSKIWGGGREIAIFVYFSQIIKLVAKSKDYINSYNKF